MSSTAIRGDPEMVATKEKFYRNEITPRMPTKQEIKSRQKSRAKRRYASVMGEHTQATS